MKLELRQSDAEESYREMLNECYGDKDGLMKVCGFEYEPWRVLEAIDPLAYRVGLNDYESDLEENEDEN